MASIIERAKKLKDLEKLNRTERWNLFYIIFYACLCFGGLLMLFQFSDDTWLDYLIQLIAVSKMFTFGCLLNQRLTGQFKINRALTFLTAGIIEVIICYSLTTAHQILTDKSVSLWLMTEVVFSGIMVVALLLQRIAFLKSVLSDAEKIKQHNEELEK